VPLGCLLVRVAGHEESHIIHKRLGFSIKSICIEAVGIAHHQPSAEVPQKALSITRAFPSRPSCLPPSCGGPCEYVR
jgi:hypothetical protein